MLAASFLPTVAAVWLTVVTEENQWIPGMEEYKQQEQRRLTFYFVYPFAILTWFLSIVPQSILSQYRELAADRAAALFSGDPSALSSALMKMSGSAPQIPLKDARSLASLNAFCISPCSKRYWWQETGQRLASSHPSLEQRLKQLEQIQVDMD